MRRLAALAVLLGLSVPLAFPQPRVNRAALQGIELSLDNTIRRLDVNDPYDLLGNTRGVYLAGYGAVFTCEVNLVITPVTPFHHPLEGPQIAKLHQKKLARLAVLKMAMRQALVFAGSSLDAVPANEQIVVGVTLFYRSIEQRDGLPSQILMQAPRQTLLDFKTRKLSQEALDAMVRTEEF